MDRKYWERIAPGYNEEIFDVQYNDKKGIIKKAIRKLASPGRSAIDIGCAVGKWLPLLSSSFGKITAVDISARNLSIAEKLYPELTNVTYRRADMSSASNPFKNFDVAICINAILTDSLQKRTRFFQHLAACLKKGGTAILVVPSLESWLLTRIVQNQWKIDPSLFKDQLTANQAAARYKDIRQGNAEIDNVPTKHYLAEELKLLLGREGFEVEEPRKINYTWKTEFVKPPSWLKEPSPWDWMVQARRIR